METSVVPVKEAVSGIDVRVPCLILSIKEGGQGLNPDQERPWVSSHDKPLVLSQGYIPLPDAIVCFVGRWIAERFNIIEDSGIAGRAPIKRWCEK
eukprot:467361-Karenia_brevis.AAC.1